jgi:nucleoside-diphosphate-sugar epimerase
MMKQFLVTGVSGGLGKYLFDNLPDCSGLHRTNFDEVSSESYDTIIHCAYNKENIITDYKQYIEDNIFLLQKVKKIKHKKFVYISSIDVYNEQKNNYSLFKMFAESLLNSDDLILRLSCLLGKTSKPNHVSKIMSNVEHISLEENSTFNYTLYSELLSFFSEKLHINKIGICDFVANDFVYLKDVISFAKSDTKTGQYCYNSKYQFVNPIYLDHPEYNKSSLEKLNLFISNSE